MCLGKEICGPLAFCMIYCLLVGCDIVLKELKRGSDPGMGLRKQFWKPLERKGHLKTNLKNRLNFSMWKRSTGIFSRGNMVY